MEPMVDRRRVKRQRWPLLVWAAAALPGRAASAATVVKLSPEQDRVLISLSQSELRSISDDQELLLKVNIGRFITAATVTKINAQKQTAVLALAEADERFIPGLELHLQPLLDAVASSPLITSSTQHPYGTRSFIEGSGGPFYEASTEQVAGAKGKQSANGTRLLAHGYMVLGSPLYGLSLDYEHRTATADLNPVGSSASLAVHDDELTPGAWLQVQPQWRLGLTYHYTVLVQNYSGDIHGSYQFTLGQPAVALLWSSAESEMGVDVNKAHNKGARAEYAVFGQPAAYATRYYKAPAEILVHSRRATSAYLTWGLALGYILFDRSQGPGQELEPRASIEQLLRLRAAIEQRYSDSSRLTLQVAYDGNKARALSTLEQSANMASVQVSYQVPAGDNWTLGGTLDLGGGVASLNDTVVDASGKESAVSRTTTGYRGSLLLFAACGFADLIRHGRRP